MAKSGYIEKSFGAAYSIRVDWTQESQSIADNTSTVKFVCNVVSTAANASFMGLAKTDTLTVNGKTYSMSHGVFSVKGISTTKLWETTVTVAHDADGSFSAKAISCKVVLEFSLSSSGYIESVTASGTMALDTIARASTMTYSGTTLGSNVTFVVKAASTAFRHKLTYKYGSKTGTIFSNKAAGTQTWAPSIDLASEFPNDKTGTVTYTLTTTNGSTTVGTKTYTSEWKIPTSAAPTVNGVWVTIDPYNAGTAAAGISAFVQGYSKAQVTFHDDEVSYKYGASWKSYKIVCNGVTDSASPYRTGVLGGTSADIVCTVEDTRGYTASSTFSIVILPYSKPKITDISLYRSNADGTPNSAGLCIYAKAKLTYAALEGMNACPLLGYYRAQADKTYPSVGIELQSETGRLLTEAALTTQTYVAKIEATDSLGNSVSYEATIPTDSVAFHIKAGGKGAAFGKYCEDDNLLDIAWNVRFGGRVDGVAPAGFGLGGAEVFSIDDIDTLCAPGFYAISGTATIAGITANYWYMLVYGYGEGTQQCAQEMRPVSATYSGNKLHRQKNSGTWSSWRVDSWGCVAITTTGENLDNYTTPGWYYFKEAPTGIPGGVNGWLQVADVPGMTGIKQIWYRFGTPGTNDYDTWVRTYSPNTGWGKWWKVMFTEDSFLLAKTLSLTTADQTNYEMSTIAAYSRSGVVDVHINTRPTTVSSSWLTIATLPSGYRPPVNIYKVESYYNASSNYANLRLRITTAGLVQLCLGTAGANYAFNATFVMA